MADSAGMGSPQPGDGVTDGYVQVQSQAPSTSPGDKFSLAENTSVETMRRPGTAHTMATQLGGGGTPVSAAGIAGQIHFLLWGFMYVQTYWFGVFAMRGL